MRRLRALPILLAATAAPAQAPADAAAGPDRDPSLALQSRLAELAERLYPSVVTVTAFVRDDSAARAETDVGRAAWVRQFGSADYPGFRRIGAASGIVMSEQGHVLTCRHALLTESGELADVIDVETEDQKHTVSTLVGAEPTLNLAVVKLEVYQPGYPPGFRVAAIGDSEALAPGHWAVAVGDPWGPERFFGVGSITSLPSRECYQEMLSATYLQASLRVHPEAYGGPLCNLRGEVVGILLPRAPTHGQLALQDSYGIEFALPSNVFAGLYRAICQVGSVRSPWLGFAVTSRAELLRERGAEAFNAMQKPRFGIMVENTFAPSPAAGAGIEPGDFLAKFDGQDVYTPIDFQRYLYLAGIGASVELEIFRGGETFKRRLVIEERPAHATTR